MSFISLVVWLICRFWTLLYGLHALYLPVKKDQKAQKESTKILKYEALI